MVFIIMLIIVGGSIFLYPFIMLIEAIIASIVESISKRSWTPVLIILGIVVFLIIIPAIVRAGVL